MKTSSFKQAIEAQFDCLSKKVIKRAVKKGYRDMKGVKNTNVYFRIFQIMNNHVLENWINTKAIILYSIS